MPFPIELARGSALEVSRLIRDFKDNVDSGNPVYLRDGNPESYIGKLNLATARRSCRKWASEGIGQNGGTDAVMDGFCKPYLQDIGEYPGEPTAQPPFTGGQCPGVEYNGVIEITLWDFDLTEVIGRREITASGGTAVGPIEAARVGPPLDSEGRSTTIELLGQNGWETVTSNISRRYEGPAKIISLSRADGQPDVCGDPPPEYEPPDPRPDPGPPSPITIAPDFDVDIDVDFFPDGTFNIKFNFGGEGTDPGDDPVEVPVDPAPETREPGGAPGDPVTGTPGSEEEGEAAGDEILVGVLVEIDSAPPNANILFTGAGPVYKGPYYVYLGVEDRLDLQPEGATARQSQFYFAPSDSTHWRVTANAGYTTTITPYYRPRNEA